MFDCDFEFVAWCLLWVCVFALVFCGLIIAELLAYMFAWFCLVLGVVDGGCWLGCIVSVLFGDWF